MEYAATFGFAIWLQAQDYWLSRNGIAHEGEVANRLGLAGIPVAAESIAIATIVQLVRDTGCRVHLTRLSSAAGVALVKAARDEGLPVTCDIGVHHLLLTENDIGFFNPHARFCPPLRAQNDRLALSMAAASPVGAEDKLLPFGEAKPGATGLEVLLPLTLKWAESLKLSLSEALARITSAPAEVLGLSTGQIAVGAAADICIFDPEENWQVTPEALKSRGKNSPWTGYLLSGKVKTTLVAGRVVYQA
jgi:dihydroorotase